MTHEYRSGFVIDCEMREAIADLIALKPEENTTPVREAVLKRIHRLSRERADGMRPPRPRVKRRI